MLLIIDRPNERDPLLWDLYSYLIANYDVHLSQRTSTDIQTIVKDEMYGKMPTRIYRGFSLGTSLELSIDYINENQIPVTVSIGDPNLFTTVHKYTKSLWALDTIDSLILTWPDNGPDYYFDKRISDFQNKGYIAYDRTKAIYGDRTQTFLKRAKHIHTPWGFNPDHWRSPDKKKKRPIDINMVCAIHRTYPKHENRRKVIGQLSKLDCRKQLGNLYGAYYRETLKQSKIFIVLTGTNFLTQKYLEGALSGCLLIGNIPTEPKNTFVDGETMVGLEDYDTVNEVVEYYLEHPQERKRMTRECYDRVVKNYNIEVVTKELVEAIM